MAMIAFSFELMATDSDLKCFEPLSLKETKTIDSVWKS